MKIEPHNTIELDYLLSYTFGLIAIFKNNLDDIEPLYRPSMSLCTLIDLYIRNETNKK